MGRRERFHICSSALAAEETWVTVGSSVGGRRGSDDKRHRDLAAAGDPGPNFDVATERQKPDSHLTLRKERAAPDGDASNLLESRWHGSFMQAGLAHSKQTDHGSSQTKRDRARPSLWEGGRRRHGLVLELRSLRTVILTSAFSHHRFRNHGGRFLGSNLHTPGPGEKRNRCGNLGFGRAASRCHRRLPMPVADPGFLSFASAGARCDAASTGAACLPTSPILFAISRRFATKLAATIG